MRVPHPHRQRLQHHPRVYPSQDRVGPIPVDGHAGPPCLDDALKRGDVLTLTLAAVTERVSDAGRPPASRVMLQAQTDQLLRTHMTHHIFLVRGGVKVGR